MQGTLTAGLESRLVRGESYLEQHPDDAEAWVLYWRLMGEYAQICMAEEIHSSLTAVTLALPEGVTWQKNKYTLACKTVRVMMHSQPTAEDEMSLAQLADWNETMAMVGR